MERNFRDTLQETDLVIGPNSFRHKQTFDWTDDDDDDDWHQTTNNDDDDKTGRLLGGVDSMHTNNKSDIVFEPT